MKKFKKVVETIITDENGKEEKTTITTLHTIKKWEELTREEKEKEIERHQESIYSLYQEDMYESFKYGIDDLRYEFKNIQFEDIYMGSNSQGWWISSINDFKYSTDDLIVYGEQLSVYDIDFKIRKTIESFEINIDDYYVDSIKLEKIKETQKYKKWLKAIEEDMQKWVDRVNEMCSDLGNSEYYSPYNLDNEEDKEFLDYYFENIEFESVEEVK